VRIVTPRPEAGPRQFVPWQPAHAVLVHRLVGLGRRVADQQVHAVAPEFMDDVDDLAVAQIATIRLGGEAQHVDAVAFLQEPLPIVSEMIATSFIDSLSSTGMQKSSVAPG